MTVYRIFPAPCAENPVIFSCAYIGLRKRKKAHRSKCAAKLIDEMSDGNIHNQPPSPKSSDREKKQDQRDVDSHSKDPKDGTPAHRRPAAGATKTLSLINSPAATIMGLGRAIRCWNRNRVSMDDARGILLI